MTASIDVFFFLHSLFDSANSVIPIYLDRFLVVVVNGVIIILRRGTGPVLRLIFRKIEHIVFKHFVLSFFLIVLHNFNKVFYNELYSPSPRPVQRLFLPFVGLEYPLRLSSQPFPLPVFPGDGPRLSPLSSSSWRRVSARPEER